MSWSTPISPLAVRAWLAAVQQPLIAADLTKLFALATKEIAGRGPACWASGRCCNFAKSGHRLYVTGLEAAWTVHHARITAVEASGILGSGSENRGGVGFGALQTAARVSLPQLSLMSVEQAKERGDCPYLVESACSVHTIKPLACRVYFCDQSAQMWQHDLSESLLAKLRALHEEHAVPYIYAEWRELLVAVCEVTNSDVS